MNFSPRALVLWVVATALGESLGVVASAMLGAVITQATGSNLHPIEGHGLVALGGLVEGACLGATQAWALQRGSLPAPPLPWAAWTAVAMAFAWTAAALISEGLAAGVNAGPGLAGVGLLLGAIVGVLVGLAQGRLLNPPQRMSVWVTASTIGWAIGVVVHGMGSAAIPAGAWLPTHFLLLATTGAAAGACVGAVSTAGWLLAASQRTS